MRRFVSTSMILAACALAAPAFASSIEPVTGLSSQHPSFLYRSCADCPAPVETKNENAYQVPALPSGSQTAEVVEIDGEKKLRRIESWLGGSPVVVVTSAEGWSTQGTTIVAGSSVEPQIDRESTTAAVDPTVAPSATAPALAGFELRLN